MILEYPERPRNGQCIYQTPYTCQSRRAYRLRSIILPRFFIREIRWNCPFPFTWTRSVMEFSHSSSSTERCVQSIQSTSHFTYLTHASVTERITILPQHSRLSCLPGLASFQCHSRCHTKPEGGISLHTRSANRTCGRLRRRRGAADAGVERQSHVVIERLFG